MQALLGNRKRLLIALGLLLVAAAVAVGSTAVFTSSSANPGNAFTAGTLEVSGDAGAILTADGLVPGDTVERLGDDREHRRRLGRVLAHRRDHRRYGRLAAATPLAQALDLTITEGATEVYNGPYDGFPGASPVDLGSWAAGEAHTYDFVVTFPEGGRERQPVPGRLDDDELHLGRCLRVATLKVESRRTWLDFASDTRVMVTLLAGGVIAFVVVFVILFSNASFTQSSHSRATSSAPGQVGLTLSKPGPIVDAADLRPGQSRSGDIEVTTTGHSRHAQRHPDRLPRHLAARQGAAAEDHARAASRAP